MNNAPVPPVRDNRATAQIVSQPPNILQEMSPIAMSDMLDSLSDLVCVCIDGKIRHVNTPGLAILDADSPEALIGLPFQSLICDDFAATIEDIIAVMADEPEATPMRFVIVKCYQKLKCRWVVEYVLMIRRAHRALLGKDAQHCPPVRG